MINSTSCLTFDPLGSLVKVIIRKDTLNQEIKSVTDRDRAKTNEKVKYEKALELDTYDSYQDFIRDYPYDKYTELANTHKLRFLENDFTQAKKENTIESYINFRKKYSYEMDFRIKANEEISNIIIEDFNQAKSQNTVLDFEQFINDLSLYSSEDIYIASAYITKAKQEIEIISQEDYSDAKEVNTIDSYEVYIKKYTDSKYVNKKHIELCKEELEKKEIREAKRLKWFATEEYINLKKQFPDKFLNSIFTVREGVYDFNKITIQDVFLDEPLKRESLGEDFDGNIMTKYSMFESISYSGNKLSFNIVTYVNEPSLKLSFKFKLMNNTAILKSIYVNNYETGEEGLITDWNELLYGSAILLSSLY